MQRKVNVVYVNAPAPVNQRIAIEERGRLRAQPNYLNLPGEGEGESRFRIAPPLIIPDRLNGDVGGQQLGAERGGGYNAGYRQLPDGPGDLRGHIPLEAGER